MTAQEQSAPDSTNSDYRYSCGIVSTSTYETGKTPPIQCVEEFWPLKTPSQFMTSRKSECNFVTTAPTNVNSSSLFVANNEPGPRTISMDSTSTYSSGSTPPKTPKHHLRFHINPFKFSKTRNKSAGTIPASSDALNSGYSGSHNPSATSSAFSLSSGDRSGSTSKLSPQPRESTAGTYFDRSNAQGKLFTKVSNTVLETNKMVVDYDPATGNKIINKYMIIREIGRGCHGKVKLCQDIETGTFFAIKIVEKSFRRRLGQKQSQSSSLDKIRKEIAILKKCRHPHVVRLYEVIDDPEAKKIYLVLEYVDGGEMTWRDEYDKPILSLDCSRQVLRDVVLGLEYLHHQGIIHRDIKPANLLWTKDGVVKISDFGVSYFSRNRNSLAFQPHLCMENGRSLNYLKDDRSSPSLQSTSGDDSGESFHAYTHTNNDADESNELELAKTAGSPAFFAPELCYSGEEFSDLSPDCQNSKTGSSYNRDSRGSQVTTSKPPVTKAIDVWALGITLYCLIYGRCPFMAETEYELFHLIPKKPLEFPEDVPIPSSLKDLLSRLLEKNPLQRITLEEIKHHPWVIQDLSNPEQWHRETNPSKYESLEATEEEVKRAVTLKDRLKKHIRKITTSIFHVGINIGLRRKSKTSLE